ncbi:MAG TPA: C40 family peptidase, partial [Chondromyces sp.]|nr:C40 family peptidase [Chondromyces sp.]
SLEVSFDTRLPVIQEEKDWIRILTPANESKWIKRSDVKLYKKLTDIPKPTGEQVVQTGKKFLGLPYLWSGTSSFGFDCSGFTYTVYKHHGIVLPRDASEQFKQGQSIQKRNMQPGDLLFFAYNKGKGKVHHVAMYAGGGKMIHSPNSSRSIEIISIYSQPYHSEFAGARRFIQ